MRVSVMATVAAMTLVGCADTDRGPIKPKELTNVPMATDGPNQVVLQLPGMT